MTDEAAFRLLALGVDAEDPPRLARFWGHALGWEVGPATEHGVELVPTDGTRFTLWFLPTAAPKPAAKNSIHLDLTTESAADQRDSVDAFVARGARPVDIGQRPEEGHVVLADPEGNELCLIGPGNTFLAGCGRFGSVTCDGSPAAGRFWSAVLGWPLVWDQDDVTAIRAPDGAGPLITWGPPVPETTMGDRLRLVVAPASGIDAGTAIERLRALGATGPSGVPRQGGAIVLADPDGTELCLRPG